MNASSPRSTNGSYTVPTGSSGCPDRSQDRPSCPSSRNRFISLMPSSMCCPCGPSAHFSTGSSLHERRAAGLNTPFLLMKPARFVDVATSGAVVTRYGAKRSSRDSSTRIRPNASWVEIGRPDRMPVESGTATTGGRPGAGRARCSRRAATHCPARVIGSSRSHSVPRVRPSRSRISSIWIVVSSAE